MKNKFISIIILLTLIISIPNIDTKDLENNESYQVDRLLSNSDLNMSEGQIEIEQSEDSIIGAPKYEVQEEGEWVTGESVRVDYLGGNNLTAKDRLGGSSINFQYTGIEFTGTTLSDPSGMAYDSIAGLIYVAEYGSDDVDVFYESNLTLKTTWDGTRDTIWDVAVNESGVELYTLEKAVNTFYVEVYNKNTGTDIGGWTVVTGSSVARAGGIAINDTAIFTFVSALDKLECWDTSGVKQYSVGQTGPGSSQGDIDIASDVETDPSGNYVFTTDLNTWKIQKWDADDGSWLAWGGYMGGGTGQLDSPYGLYVTTDYVYTVDTGTDLVKKWTVSTVGYVDRWDFGYSASYDLIVRSDGGFWWIIEDGGDHIYEWYRTFPDLTGAVVTNEWDYWYCDGFSAGFLWDYEENPVVEFNATYVFYMQTTSHPDKVGLRYSLAVTDGGSPETPFNNEYLIKTLGEDAYYSEDTLAVYLNIFFDYEDYGVKIYFVDTSTNTIVSATDTSGSAGSVSEILFLLDHIYVSTRGFTFYPRLLYQYTSSSTMLLKLTVQCYTYNTKIRIYTRHTVATVTPYASYTDEGDSILIENTLPVTYTIDFFEQYANHLFSVYDVTGIFMDDPGFENGYSDWTYVNYVPTLKTDIVFEGSRSVRIYHDFGGTYEAAFYVKSSHRLRTNTYLIRFNYYRTDTFDVYFKWNDRDGAEKSEKLDETQNVWLSFTKLINTTTTPITSSMKFSATGIYGQDSELYIDNVQIWYPNGQVRTTGYANGYMETGMFATMRSIDGLGNPAIPYHVTKVDLRDRNADVDLATSTVYADEYGRIELYFTLPSAYQMEWKEYTLRTTSTETGNITDSHFTPEVVNHYDFAQDNGTFGLFGWDYSEGGDSNAYTEDDITLHVTRGTQKFRNGYVEVYPESNAIDTKIHHFAQWYDLNKKLFIDSDYYEYIIIRLRTNVSDIKFKITDWANGDLTGWHELPQSAGVLDWETYTFNLTAVGAWSGTENGLTIWFDEVGGDGLLEIDNFFWVDGISLYHLDEPEVVQSASYVYLTTESEYFVYYVEIDQTEQSYVFDLDPFLLDLSIGHHDINITPFLDLSRRWICYISADVIMLEYDIAEDGVMKIIIHDQMGMVMNFDRFKTYIDDVRLYDNYLYIYNTSATFNLTIVDLFDNMLYQDTSETFEQFKEILITLYSVKIQNVQENPVWVKTSRGAKNYSEWVFSFEVIKYYLEEDTYSIRINYTSVDDQFNVDSNGTSVEYSYSVNKDTAIRVSGASLQDIYNNLIELSEEVGNVNISLTNQIIDVEISVNNTQDNITVQITNFNENTTEEFNEVKDAIDYLNRTVYNNTLYYTVHFALADQAGIGLPWETFKVTVNNNRSYDSFMNNVLYGTNLSIVVQDFYDSILLEEEVQILKETEVPLFVPVYWVYFKNDGDYPAIVELERNGIEAEPFTVPVGEMFAIRLTKGKYTVSVRYQDVQPEQDASTVEKNEAIPEKIAYEGTIKVSAQMPTVVDVSTPSKPISEAAREEYFNVQFVLFIGGVVIGSVIGFFVKDFVLPYIIGKAEDVRSDTVGGHTLYDKNDPYRRKKRWQK